MDRCCGTTGSHRIRFRIPKDIASLAPLADHRVRNRDYEYPADVVGISRTS
jgi:hypothetical protein